MSRFWPSFVDVVFKPDPINQQQLDRIETLLLNIAKGQRTIMVDLSHLKAAAEQLGTDVAALAEALRNSPDQTAVNDIADKLDAVDLALKGLIPAAPAPTPAPEPVAEQPAV